MSCTTFSTGVFAAVLSAELAAGLVLDALVAAGVALLAEFAATVAAPVAAAALVVAAVLATEFAAALLVLLLLFFLLQAAAIMIRKLRQSTEAHRCMAFSLELFALIVDRFIILRRGTRVYAG